MKAQKDGQTVNVNILFHKDICQDKGGTSMYIRRLAVELSKYFKVRIFAYSDSERFSVRDQGSFRIYLVPRMNVPILNLLKVLPQGNKFYDSLSAFNPKLYAISERVAPADYVLCVDTYCAVVIGLLSRILGKKFVLRSNDSLLWLGFQVLSSFSRSEGLLILLYAFVFESWISKLAHLVSVPSRRTLNSFRESYGLKNVFVSPPGNEGGSGNSCSSIRKLYSLKDIQPIILFIGTGDWPPNRLAIKYIQDELAPFLEREVSDARIFIVGSKTEEFSHSVKTRNLIVTGEVADLGPYLEAADLGIAPVTIMGGVSAKAIEYLCSGLPVVMTETVAETLIPQFGMFISNMEDFHSKVAEVLKNPCLHEMRQAIKREALENYSWERIGLDFARQIQSLFHTC